MFGAVGRLGSALAFGAAIAAAAIWVGVDDMESYEHAFFSLDRGTALQAFRVLGHPVYTLGLGLGVRLPLHGSLGASPAAAFAPYLPPPVTYGLLIAFAIAASAMVVRHALEPLCGRLVSWLAIVLLFCSIPMVNYTIYSDWPETAVTYCTFVGCVFAPHALLSLLQARRSARARALAMLSLAGAVWGLVGAAHPGYWTLLAVTLVAAAILTLARGDHSPQSRLTVIGVLAVAAFLAVALQLPDIGREIDVARTTGGEMSRFISEGRGSLVSGNLFPPGDGAERMPFTFLIMAVVALLVGVTANDARARTLIVGSALVSIVLGIISVTLSPGSSTYAPSNTWTLRDPAIAFAVLGAASAAGSVRRSHGVIRSPVGALALGALLLAGLQGPLYAGALVVAKIGLGDRQPWTRDMTSPAERVATRGVGGDRLPLGARVALWPGAREKMRATKHASTDLADAGDVLVTAWTKQRTMRGLVEPNEFLFNQSTDLAPDVLCDANAVRLLQLRFLLLPPDVECPPWTRVPGPLVDEWLEVASVRDRDQRVNALRVTDLTPQFAAAPALSAGAALPAKLVPLPGTSVTIGTRNVVIALGDVAKAAGQALVLPIAYDPSWQASSGELRSVGGLVTLVGVEQPRVTLDFVPDAVAVTRAVSMTIAQILAVVGFLGLAWARPA